MSAVLKPYLITWEDFKGRKVQKAWRGQAPCHVRSKAMQQATCSKILSVAEISEPLFARLAEHQRQTNQYIRNRK